MVSRIRASVIALGAALFVAVLWGGSWWWLVGVCRPAPDNIGVFGDSFGAVNALFSGLAFVGLIFAIVLQRNELQLQREELQMTRDTLKSQKEEMEKSAAAQANLVRLGALTELLDHLSREIERSESFLVSWGKATNDQHFKSLEIVVQWSKDHPLNPKNVDVSKHVAKIERLERTRKELLVELAQEYFGAQDALDSLVLW